MNSRSGNQIREDFLRFFEGKQHRRVASSSLVPANDPTLLFANAGMNQFKDVFLGLEPAGEAQRPYTRATSSQKCVRAGGKHNDLENVGFTRRHHTFFEMLGNFSFGDYFKRDAIAFAWELLTSPDWFAIPPEKLYVTIFEGEGSVPLDSEAEALWIAVGVPASRIVAMPAKDNFWQMGETGPCGPCSEIFFDLGLAASEHRDANGAPQDRPFPEDDQRYIEIWNLVFMQFDRAADGTLTPLPKPSIDTGMGLERIAAVLQGKLSNYETDLFTPLIARAAQLTNFDLAALSPEATTQAGVEDQPAPHPPSSRPEALSEPEASRTGRSGEARPEPVEGTPVFAQYATDLATTPHPPSSRPEAAGRSGETPVFAQSATDLATTPQLPSSRPEAAGRSGETPVFSQTALELAAVSDTKGAPSLRIIADHARAATFLIADGVLPSNEGRGYVLRKIMRRAIRHGRLLGQTEPFLHGMVPAVRDEMAAAYPELTHSADRISKTILAEEEQFARTLRLGLAEFERSCFELLQREVNQYPGGKQALLDSIDRMREALPPQSGEQLRLWLARDAVESIDIPHPDVRSASSIASLAAYFSDFHHQVVFEGREAFRIYETFGLPLDFMQDLARDSYLAFDDAGFELAKQEEQARARASWRGASQKSASPAFRDLPRTEFTGYTATRLDGAQILAIVRDGLGVPSLAPGDEGEVVLDATSFYAESGGQVGDVGLLTAQDHITPVATVLTCTKPVQGVFAHRVRALQTLAVGDLVDTVVDADIRRSTMRNHTGTHLLQAALREVLGTHVKQAGSLNNPSRLRFDFSHFQGVAEPELADVESIVNREILRNTPVVTLVDVPIDVAVNELHATALFGEKYGDRVRVVKIGDFSTELCGGTHTEALGEIGLLKLTGESSVSSGVRRVEAVTGSGSLAAFRRDAEVARVATQLLSGSADAVESPARALEARLAAADEETKRLRRELEQLRLKSATASLADAASSAVDVQGIKLLAQRVGDLQAGVDKKELRTLVDTLRSKLGSGVVVLGTAAEGRVSLVVGVTKDLTARVQAGKLVAQLAPLVGGKGGGRPDLAEAGGSDPGSLDAALARTPDLLRSLLP